MINPIAVFFAIYSIHVIVDEIEGAQLKFMPVWTTVGLKSH
jgi:hypothetical protein